MDWSRVHFLTRCSSMRYKTSTLEIVPDSENLLTLENHGINICMKCFFNMHQIILIILKSNSNIYLCKAFNITCLKWGWTWKIVVLQPLVSLVVHLHIWASVLTTFPFNIHFHDHVHAHIHRYTHTYILGRTHLECFSLFAWWTSYSSSLVNIIFCIIFIPLVLHLIIVFSIYD